MGSIYQFIILSISQFNNFSYNVIPRPDGRDSPVKFVAMQLLAFTWRAAVSQEKHQQVLTQINRLKQTAGKCGNSTC
jgi:hypothetical protein